MNKIFSNIGFLFLISTLFSTSLFAQNSDELQEIKFKGWKQAETEHFRFIYEDSSKQTAEQYALIADDAWNKIAKIYSFPQEKTDIFITDRTNTVNAYTFFCPPRIGMFTTPVIYPTFGFRDDWKKLFFTHELIHIANITFPEKEKILPTLIGPFAYNLDISFVNGWALEGLTTVLETELTNGGRGRSPYFELEYKAPTLDNAFISYNEIGMEEEPPYGQSYVMGYLIMRSIADRWGLSALADIERNRKTCGSWEASVKLVTGQEASDIYKDVKIALAKKYADERKIPEGQIISPRNVNTFYYKPAIVFDDGTLITLRSTSGMPSAVVKLDPSAKSGSNYLSKTNPQEDLNTVFKETILVECGFSETDGITADENETVYISSWIEKLDRLPGMQMELPLYKWTKDDGLTQLTKKGSFNQPSVSRNGNLLVAVEQKGLNMRLVKVDIQTGKITSLLEDENLSFVEPAVNADGTQIAFLVLDGQRARVAVLDVKNPYDYKIVANDDETIYDPSYPVWTKDNTLTFCCNYRGRLEIFELKQEDDNYKPTPVVADPIGATWAYKNDIGIFYSSRASTGDVIKIKPSSEWGIVPDYDGPTPTGQIICFGNLENDYPDFKPYFIPSEVEVPEKTDEEKKAERKASLEKLSKKSENEEPIPVEGKTVLHRKDEFKEKAENANSTTTTLQNEKRFLPFPTPVLYIPYVDFITDTVTSEPIFGIGAGILLQTPMLQNSFGLSFINCSYYPTINNFDGSIDCVIPIGNSELDLFIVRVLTNINKNDLKYFQESNLFQLGYFFPLYHRLQSKKELDISFISALTGSIKRISQTVCSPNGDFENNYQLSALFGLESFASKKTELTYNSLCTSVIGLGCYDFTENKFLLGVESEITYTFTKDIFPIKASILGRYTPFPAKIKPDNSLVKINGNDLDCSYAGRIVPHLGLLIQNIANIGLDSEFYGEFLINFAGEKQFEVDEYVIGGYELAINSGRTKMAFGASYNFYSIQNHTDFFDNFNCYFTFKYNGLRF